MALKHGRILSRIQSRHVASWRAKGKAPLLRRLTTAKELLRGSLICTIRAQSLVDDVDDLQRQFDRLEDMDTLEARSFRLEERLLGLVKGIQSILLQYEPDLKLIPYTPGLWNGNATESLTDRLRKISRSVKACDEFLRAARRYRIFSNIAVEFVNLQQGGRRLSVGATSDIDEIIEASCTRETLSKILSRCHKSILNIQESIKARLRETSRSHIEVQLVLYYEHDARLLRPPNMLNLKRLLSVPLLLQIHGQYHIPSTHGKLYDTWKWPAPTQLPSHSGAKIDLQRLLPKFGDAIDRNIRECLNAARAVRRINPLESRVDMLAVITPSILSSISRHSRSVRSRATLHQELQGDVDIAPPDKGDADDEFLTSSTMTVKPSSQPSGPRVDTPLTSPMVGAEDLMSCGGTVTPTMRRHGSRGSSVTSHGGRSQGFGEVQIGPLCLR